MGRRFDGSELFRQASDDKMLGTHRTGFWIGSGERDESNAHVFGDRFCRHGHWTA